MIITITNKEHKEYIKGKYVSAHNFVTCIENNILFIDFTYFTNTLTRKYCRYYPSTKLFILVK